MRQRGMDCEAAVEGYGVGQSYANAITLQTWYHDGLVFGEGNGRILFGDLVVRNLLPTVLFPPP